MKATAAMTREEYINFTIDCLKENAKRFTEAHYPELKEYYAEEVGRNQYELVRFGYTWEQVTDMEIEVYKTA